MNRKMVFNMVGRIMCIEGLLLLLPALTALIYKESCINSILISAAVALSVGGIMILITLNHSKLVFASEGFAIVGISWVMISLVGALPFFLSGEIPNYADALFETVSGLTTTGASILDNVEEISHGLLFWRSFTHWIGGMGVLVLVMAIIPGASGRNMHIMRAEMPGPIVGKLVPRVRDTAKILYLIYIAMTALETVFLLFGGMSFFEAIVHALGTAGTGGFGIRSSSIGEYSPYIQWVVTVFMLLFGVNFNLYYLMLIRRFKSAIGSRELWCYGGIVVLASTVVAFNVRPLFVTTGETVRHSVFQVASIMSTTGYSTCDFLEWPSLSKAILFVLLFFGGCAGSTAGGLKTARIMMMVGIVRRELRKLLHPRSVSSVKLEGHTVEEETISSLGTYFIFYMGCILITFLIISFEPFGIETNFSAAVSCFNNVGPGFGLIGPASSYSLYSSFSKIILSVAMLLGRLEIYPLVLAFAPSAWVKKHN